MNILKKQFSPQLEQSQLMVIFALSQNYSNELFDRG
jgi:hypothetical protein